MIHRIVVRGGHPPAPHHRILRWAHRRAVPVACFTGSAALLASAGVLVVSPQGSADVDRSRSSAAPADLPAVASSGPGASAPATPEPATPAAGFAPPAPGQSPAPGPITAPIKAPAPAGLRIPDLDIDQSLTELGVEGSVLQVPDRYDDIGWWREGPAPGEPGAAVMVGHVDSETGPAVFAGLGSLQSGDPIVVGRSDGSSARFQVVAVDRLPRHGFPSERVYRKSGPPALHLITCGGRYDAEEGRYEDNVVVSARLVELTPTRVRGARTNERKGAR